MKKSYYFMILLYCSKFAKFKWNIWKNDGQYQTKQFNQKK